MHICLVLNLRKTTLLVVVKLLLLLLSAGWWCSVCVFGTEQAAAESLGDKHLCSLFCQTRLLLQVFRKLLVIRNCAVS